MNIFYLLFIVVQVLIGIHFFMPFFMYLLGLIGKKTKTVSVVEEADYAVIVTAYKQITQVPSAVNSILKSDYQNYIVYVVADNCEDISSLIFDDPRVVVLQPEEILASNTKSHFYAIDRFKRAHERLTIIDSDNLIHTAYFKELNVLFDLGFTAVQGVRAAKNLDTTYACLDEAGDIYYRLADRKLMYEAGSSAALSGSGMAFTTQLYRDCLENNPIEGAGFDKILQYEIISRKIRIAFAEKAIVYDEKTSKTDQLVNQRSRWINTWFKYLFLGGKMLLKSISGLNLNQFLFSTMLLRPPLFIMILLSGLCFFIDIFIMPSFLIFWILAVISFFITVFAALSYFKADQRIYNSLRNAPKFIYFQILALLKAKNANKISVATEHHYDHDENK